MKQTKSDSAIETVANTTVGFIISWLVWLLIIVPIWKLPVNAGHSLGIVAIFTVTSLLRQYVIRRLFNGRNIGEWLVLKIHGVPIDRTPED